MVKYEDILKQIEGADYIPLEQRTGVKTIAPTTTKKENIGDTAKMLGSNFISGVNSVFEGIADLGAAALVPAAKLTSKIVDNKVGKFIFGEDAADYHNNPLYQIAQPMLEENISQEITQSAANKYDKTSYVKSGSTAANVAQGIGQVGGLLLTGKFFDFDSVLPTNTGSKVFNTIAQNINQPTSQAMFLSTTGNSYTSALKEGATEAEAIVYGLLNGAKETGTEILYGGLGSAFGTGALDEVAKKAITSNIKSKVLKKATELGVSMTAEGLEEVVATLLDPFVESVYKHKLDFSDYDSLLDDFVVGALTSGVMEGGEIAINKVNQIKNGSTNANNQKLPTNSVEQVNEENDTKLPTNTNITETTQNNIINLPTTENTQTKSIEELVESSTSKKALESLREQNNARLEALLEQQRTLNDEKQQELETEEQRVKNQQLLEETNKRIAELEAEMNALVPTANTEGMNLQESAARYDINPNSNSIKSIQTMMEKRGINARFDNTLFKNSNTNAIWTIDDNGNRSVVFNPKANPDSIIENIAIHELTHDLMSSVNSKQALDTDSILSYVKSLEGYQEARNDLIHTYSAMYNPNNANFQSLIDEEVVADVLGRKLGNQEFVSRLVNQKPNIARNIYNWVVDKLNSLVNRGGNIRNEKLYWENIKNRFENAYNMSYNNSTNEAGTRYATVKNNPYGHVKDFVKLSQKIQSDAHDAISPVAAEMGAKGKLYGSATDVNGNTYDFEIFSDMTYRVIKVEKYNSNVEEVTNERYSKTNSRYSIRSATNEQSNNDINNESNTNRRTGNENVEISTREQEQQTGNGYRLLDSKQDENNKGLNSSFSYDNQGRELTKEQQDYFKDSKVRDENGNLVTVYHGSNKAGFTVFNRNYNYYSDNKQVAQSYTGGEWMVDTRKLESVYDAKSWLKGITDELYIEGTKVYDEYGEEVLAYDSSESLLKNLKRDIQNEIGDTNAGGIYEGYVNITKPLVVDVNGDKWSAIDINGIELDNPKELLEKYGSSTFKEKGAIRTSTNDILAAVSDAIDNGELDYDGVIFKNIVDEGMYHSDSKGQKANDYVTFKSNQFKAINNMTPTTDEDIRYSKEAKEWNDFLDKNVSSTGTTGTLMAIHNLGEKKLKGILELGGIPVPSIAVTNPNLVDHSSFGNISLIFNKNTIDPSNKENEVYDRDVWSPTQPQIDYYMDSETIENVANKLGIRDYDLEDYADNNKTPEYLSDRLTRVDEIVDKYVTDNNIQYETAYKTPEMKVEFHELSEDIKQFIKNNDLTVFKLAQDENLKNEYYRLIKDYYDNANFPQQSKEYLYKEKVDFLDKWLGQQSSIDSIIVRGLQRYQDDFDLIKKGENKVVDEWQTEKNKRQAAIDNGLQEYLIQETAPLFKEKGIYNGKEYLTSSGRRRSFWELHDEYNLENIVDAMAKGSTKGTQNWVSGFGQIQAQMANRFNSLSEIKNAESQIMPDANNTRLVELREKLESDIDNLSNKYDGWGGMEIASELIADFASQTNHDMETFRKLLNENYQAFGRINDNEINQIIEHLEELRDLPTDYFEAKPQRAVDLDEIEVVVIPNNTAEEIREQLKTAGLDFVEYNPNVEGDRQRVINKFDNLKFSKNSNGKWQDFVNKHFKTEGTTTRLGDIKLPPKKEVKLPTKQPAKETTSQAKLIPTKVEAKTTEKSKVTIPMAKNDDVIKVAAKKIAKQINSTGGFDIKQRSWLETSTESDVLKDKVYISDLDPKKLDYVVQSNKKSLDSANNRLKSNGYEKTLDYVKNIMQSDKLPSASDVALMQRMIQEASKKGDAETVQDLIMDTAIIGTDLGQATQALSIIQKLTPEGQLKMYTKLVQRAKSRGETSFQNVEITPEMVQNVLEAYKKDGTYDQEDLNNRVEKFKQDIADQMKTTAGEKIDAWRYLSMLGNPKTHIRNVVSNVAMRGTIKVKNAMARTLESILPVKDRTKTWKKASNTVQNFAEQTANEMKGIITGESKYNEKSAIESKKQIFKNKTLEKISNFNSNALEAEDWFFSKKAFKDTLQEYLTAKGINTQADIENNAELVEKAKLYAVEQANIATFRQYSKLAATINQFERKSKVGKLAVEALMPFKKTPINVAKTGVNYSPIGLIKNISYDVYQLKQGNINASQFIDNLSQGITGTSLTLLGYALAKAGILSGSGGDDKDDKYDKQLGNTGYSLNIGGNSYSISWLSPVAMPLLVGSNAYEQLEEDKEWDMNVVSDTLAKTLDPLNEMSFMQGLTNALQSYGSGVDKIKGSLESTAQNYVGQFFPTLFSQFAAVTDDKKRSTKASNNSSYKFGEQTLRSVMYKIPGLRQQLEVATDIWGNEKEQSDNILTRAIESFIAPYSKTKNISTDLDEEIKRVYNETGEGGVIPNIPYAYVKYKNETYRMSANEYTEYKKTYGQNANKYLNNLINSSSYKTASDEMKAKMIDNVYDYAKAEANEQYFKGANIDYSSDELNELKELRKYGINSNSLANYVADKTQISSIRGNNNLSSSEKHQKSADVFLNSKLNDNQLSYLYSKYYSTEEKVNAINSVGIPIKEFIKYDLEDFESDYNTRNGKTISGSKKTKIINYINNNLKLSVAQKALLIKLEYNSFKTYDNQIIKYVTSSDASFMDKAYLLKRSGFNNFNNEIIDYVQKNYKTAEEKASILKNLGFTVRDGRVYY